MLALVKIPAVNMRLRDDMHIINTNSLPKYYFFNILSFAKRNDELK